MYTEQLTQALGIPAAELDPVSQATGTVTSGGINMAHYKRALFILQVGSVGAAGTVDAKLQSSASSGGTYADISGSSITQITASNKIVTLEIRDDEMPAGQPFVRLSVTVGGNAVLISALGLASEAKYKPTTTDDANTAAVAQRLVV